MREILLLKDLSKKFEQNFIYTYEVEANFLEKNKIRYKNNNTRNIIFVNLKPNYMYKEELDQTNWKILRSRYIKYEDFFYFIESLTKELITQAGLKNNLQAIKDMQDNLIYSNQAFIVLNKIARYNIIDLPISLYIDRYQQQIREVNGFWNTEEEIKKMKKLALKITKNTEGLYQYCATDFARQKILKISSLMKKVLGDEFKDFEIKNANKEEGNNRLNRMKKNIEN